MITAALFTAVPNTATLLPSGLRGDRALAWSGGRMTASDPVIGEFETV